MLLFSSCWRFPPTMKPKTKNRFSYLQRQEYQGPTSTLTPKMKMYHSFLSQSTHTTQASKFKDLINKFKLNQIDHKPLIQELYSLEETNKKTLLKLRILYFFIVRFSMPIRRFLPSLHCFGLYKAHMMI